MERAHPSFRSRPAPWRTQTLWGGIPRLRPRRLHATRLGSRATRLFLGWLLLGWLLPVWGPSGWEIRGPGLNIFLSTAWTAPPTSTRPGIIVVLTDDQGYGDVGVHGNRDLKTPHLDAFARQALEMTRFYVSPLCAPTRASLLTGRYHQRTGVLHTSRGGGRMFGDEVTLAERLAAVGYRTGIFGKWHLGDNYPMRPQDQGFHEVLIHRSGGIGQTPDTTAETGATYFQPVLWHNGRRKVAQGYCTDLFFDAALGFIETARDEPFFVYLPTNVPHVPLEIADNYVRPYREAGLPNATAKIFGMLANLDENFGRLLSRLEELGIVDDTLVVFLSDNGPIPGRYNSGLRGNKGLVYEGGIRAPFFVRWGARFAAGATIDRIAAHIDLFPTLLAAAGAPLPAGRKIDGVNLLPLWTGEILPGDWPERMLFQQMVKAILQPAYQNAAVITQRHKLVADPRRRYAASPSTGQETPRNLALFDLLLDPHEQHDRSQADPEVLTRLRRAYDEWFRDLESTRGFEPGRIDVGTPHESPTRLCRYQDGHVPTGSGVSEGWPVRIRQAGRFRVSLHWPPHGGGALRVEWLGSVTRRPLEPGSVAGEIQLSAGRGRLIVEFEDSSGERVRLDHENKSTQGDVTIVRLEDSSP